MVSALTVGRLQWKAERSMVVTTLLLNVKPVALHLVTYLVKTTKLKLSICLSKEDTVHAPKN